MARMPTPEESARNVLRIFVSHFSGRPGWVLRWINLDAPTYKRRYLHYDDMGPGMEYAVKEGWIEALPDGDSFRLTEAGFAAADDPGERGMEDGKPAGEITTGNLLQQAIRAVPAVRYALGIGGIVWVIAAIAALNVDYRVAVFGTIVMVILMVLLLVFAKLAGTTAQAFVLPMTVLVWVSILLTTGIALLLATSVFFRWPLDLHDWLTPQVPAKSEFYERREA
jgi:hypothetical protein